MPRHEQPIMAGKPAAIVEDPGDLYRFRKRRENGERIVEARFAWAAEAVDTSRPPFDDGGREHALALLVENLEATEEVRLVYHVSGHPAGHPYLTLYVHGVVRGATKPEATSALGRLEERVLIAAASGFSNHHFVSVNPEHAPDGEYCHELQPLGLLLPLRGQTHRTAHPGPRLRVIQGGRCDRADVDHIAIIDARVVRAFAFDALLACLAGLPFPVTLTLGFQGVRLDVSDLRAISAARDILPSHGSLSRTDGTAAVIRAEHGKAIRQHLANWLDTGAGYRITCTLSSPAPISPALLTQIGTTIFWNRPARVMDGSQAKAADSGVVLDLASSVHRGMEPPRVFPSAAMLRGLRVPHTSIRLADDLFGDGVVLGQVGVFQAREVRLNPADRAKHAYVIGATGTGKSTLLLNILAQDMRAGHGCCLIDPHGDLYAQALRAIPEERIEDVVLMDMSDDHVVGLNFLECSGRDRTMETGFIVNEMLQIFDLLYDLRSTGGPMFESYFRNAMLLVMEGNMGDAIGIGEGLSAPPLPHHRTYGSVYGGSAD